MEKKRNVNIDAIKIIAATLICFHHFQQVFRKAYPYPTVNFYFGKYMDFSLMVAVFFFISGLLMVEGLNARPIKTIKGALHGFAKKIFRLIPYTFVPNLLSAILCFKIFDISGEGYALINHTPTEWMRYFTTTWQGWGAPLDMPNGPVWFLCSLLQCYMLMYTIVLLTRGHETLRPIIFCAVSIMSALILNKSITCTIFSVATLRGGIAFFSGAMFYGIIEWLKNRTERARINIGIILLVDVFIISVTGMLSIDHFFFSVLGLCVVCYVLAPSIVAAASTLPQLKWRHLEFLSGASYEVYLWHVPIYQFAKYVLLLNGAQMTDNRMAMVVLAVFAWCVACVIYKYIELPLRKKILV